MDTKRRREGGMNWEFGIGLYIQELCKYKIGNEREPGGVPGGTVVKNPPAVQETRVQSLGREDPLEEGMATHSSVLAWRIPGTEEPGGLQSMGSQRVGYN